MRTTNNTDHHYLVTGDIGGTNSRMAIYKAAVSAATTDGILSHDNVLFSKTYRNADYLVSTSEPEPIPNDNGVYFAIQIIHPFLEEYFTTINTEGSSNQDDDCFFFITLAVAGIVTNNTVVLTNLNNLLIDGNSIGKLRKEITNFPLDKTHYLSKIISCRIINDFVAQGYGCLTLQPSDVVHLYGTPSDVTQLPVGPKVCVGAGTGLGECYLTPYTVDDTNNIIYTCWPSEGGHVDYTPRNDIEYELLHYLASKFGTNPARISVERVVSGIGLSNVYEFLATKFPEQTNPTIYQEFVNAAVDEQGRIIATNCTNCTICAKAMDLMMSAYGSEVGSCAIKFIPTGGLFVTGGLTPKNIHHIINKNNPDDAMTQFLQSYLHKGRVSTLLQRIPCFAVLSADTLGVRGVLYVAHEEYTKYSPTL